MDKFAALIKKSKEELNYKLGKSRDFDESDFLSEGQVMRSFYGETIKEGYFELLENSSQVYLVKIYDQNSSPRFIIVFDGSDYSFIDLDHKPKPFCDKCNNAQNVNECYHILYARSQLKKGGKNSLVSELFYETEQEFLFAKFQGLILGGEEIQELPDE